MKEVLNAQQTPISISSLLDLTARMNEGAFTKCDIVNLSPNDLHLLTMALEFTFGIKDQLTVMQEGIDILRGMEPKKAELIAGQEPDPPLAEGQGSLPEEEDNTEGGE